MLDGVDKVFTLSHIDGRHGPLQCWDLHVGARITALGRHMTLMQASGATLEWLEMRSIQLQKMKRQFVKEVRDVGGGASEWDRGRDRGRVGGGVRFGGGEGGRIAGRQLFDGWRIRCRCDVCAWSSACVLAMTVLCSDDVLSVTSPRLRTFQLTRTHACMHIHTHTHTHLSSESTRRTFAPRRTTAGMRALRPTRRRRGPSAFAI